jgi:hypothetical protein
MIVVQKTRKIHPLDKQKPLDGHSKEKREIFAGDIATVQSF